jgi:predicted GNAT family acetyltransferase
MLNSEYEPSEQVIYDLMIINNEPSAASLNEGPPGLVLRRPGKADMDALFLLQAGYEKEEVLMKNSTFMPAACRMLIEHLAAREQIMLAELGGNIVGKINTSAATSSWYQVGGVYVHPAYRGRGIATRMTSVFVSGLLAERKSVSLFVKKQNTGARSVYRRVGFAVFDDYKISYY